MIDEHALRQDPLTVNPTMKRNGHVRIFIRRRATGRVGHRTKSTDMEQLTSLVETTLNNKRKRSRQRKNIIIINYKPVFMNTRARKAKVAPPKPPVPTTTPQHQPASKPVSMPTHQPAAPHGLPEEEDPLMFIEQMYQQLFTDDGQLRQDTEPNVLANCVKHIVANSRRNSIARRESISSPVRQRKASTPSFSYLPHFKASQPPSISSSSHVLSNNFSEEEENEAETLVHTNSASNQSRRRRTSNNPTNYHSLQELHQLEHSQHHSRRTSVNTSRSHRISLDDTENEDWDRFSDLNTHRKNVGQSMGASFDEDMPRTDSKLLSSSGYQSLKSPSSRYCSNCTQSSPTAELSSDPVSSSSSIIQWIQQPVREMLTKYLHIVLISKNILLLPLFIFFLRQRSVPTSH